MKFQFSAVAALLALASCSYAQDSNGSIAGTVTDASGGRVAHAAVTLDSKALGMTRHLLSGRNGEFRFDSLAPASYRLRVNANGFAQVESVVQVLVTSIRTVEVVLSPAPVRQSVTIAAAASSLATQPFDTSRVVQGGVVTQRDLESIPLAQRSFANIAYLVPGTEPVEPSDPTKARITAVSFGGSSGLNDVLSVDGADNSDDYIGGFLQNFSPDVIQEFAVHTAQEDAATGRTVGGSVVISTKRGINDWHGDEAFYGRAAALNARYPIENPAPLPKQPFSRQNYVGSLGGPVARDKLWFFSSFEAVHEDASIAYSPSNLTQFSALAELAAQGLIPGVSSIPVKGAVRVPFRDYLATVRFDWAQSASSQWFLRAAVDNYTTRNAFVQQGTLASTGTTWHSNYLSLVLGQQWIITPVWTSSLTLAAGSLHTTQARNSDLGFALAFPFSSTAQTISGFETFGDNQFVTPITAFPVLRNQQKYQARYLVDYDSGDHSTLFGVDVIHEPVLSGALSGTAETLTVFAQNPAAYLGDPRQFSVDLNCTPTGALTVTPGTTCSSTPASNGSFSQNVQRLGAFVQDSWRRTPRLTVNYGVRYDTTFGLFIASGRSQLQNPALLTMQALAVQPFANWGAPHDYRAALAPRLGLAWRPSESAQTVLRAGFGLFYNDLAQNGWVTALQAVNGSSSCCLGASGSGSLIDPSYKTPYALHATAGIEHAFSPDWTLGVNWIHEAGVHSYRRYQYQPGYTLLSPLQQETPSISVFRTDNRSRYDGLLIHLQGNLSPRFSLVMNYTLASAETFGCVLGELFDYVNGVCNPLKAFAKGDYGPSGEDVRHRFVLAGTLHLPGRFELTTLSQAESARPFTMTTPVDVNGVGDAIDDRAVVNGVQTALDQFRGKPYIQADLRLSRAFQLHDRLSATAFAEFFNIFNRNNPGANYVTNLAALPVPVNNLANATAFCLNADCSQTTPIASLRQLRVPAGALGDFFGPGTTVGIPFACQFGARITF